MTTESWKIISKNLFWKVTSSEERCSGLLCITANLHKGGQRRLTSQTFPCPTTGKMTFIHKEGIFHQPQGRRNRNILATQSAMKLKTSPWNSIWKEIWSRQTVWEGYQPSRNFELWIDRILTQKRFFETRRDGVNFDFKLKSSIFSSARLSPNSRIRVGDSWRNCGISDK